MLHPRAARPSAESSATSSATAGELDRVSEIQVRARRPSPATRTESPPVRKSAPASFRRRSSPPPASAVSIGASSRSSISLVNWNSAISGIATAHTPRHHHADRDDARQQDVLVLHCIMPLAVSTRPKTNVAAAAAAASASAWAAGCGAPHARRATAWRKTVFQFTPASSFRCGAGTAFRDSARRCARRAARRRRPARRSRSAPISGPPRSA